MRLDKYWVWRGQAYDMASWKTPCKECGEPTDYHIGERQLVYLASDVEPVLKNLVDKWRNQNAPRESVTFRLAMKDLEQLIGETL